MCTSSWKTRARRTQRDSFLSRSRLKGGRCSRSSATRGMLREPLPRAVRAKRGESVGHRRASASFPRAGDSEVDRRDDSLSLLCEIRDEWSELLQRGGRAGLRRFAERARGGHQVQPHLRSAALRPRMTGRGARHGRARRHQEGFANIYSEAAAVIAAARRGDAPLDQRHG
jgi:hypothetical protein